MCTELRLDRLFISAFSIIPPSSSLSSRFTSYSHPSSSPSSSSRSTFKPRRFPNYSRKTPNLNWHVKDPEPNHPAFKPISPKKSPPVPPPSEGDDRICFSEKGLAYKLKDAPFEFQYSYTETPKVKPIALREPAFLPFGPKETARPWTGKAPLAKKKLPEFDSFKLPPPGKKGVKSVQAPGPFINSSGEPVRFLNGSGSITRSENPSREEVLGEALTNDEVAELVKGCLKTRRQLNMGRDGLTHNMLDNIHAHWKRRRVCKIKCKGVCTVDMDNVCHQLEEKVGGKVIHRKGGVIFLFRGRNYNYRTRPRFPLMLWKPITPIYPKLVKRVPDGLTFQEANELRNRGNNILPICHLGKNGVYLNLVNQVREAFEACELVRVSCKSMNRSDFKKIGGKLQDLVPCVLLSFEFEHILMWRGKDWKSSLPPVEINGSDLSISSVKIDGPDSSISSVEIDGSDSCITAVVIDGSDEARSSCLDDSAACDLSENNSERMSEPTLVDENERCSDSNLEIRITSTTDSIITEMPLESFDPCNGATKESFENNSSLNLIDPSIDSKELSDENASEAPSRQTTESSSIEQIEPENKTESECLEVVKLLLDQAMGSGSAVILSEIESQDSDIIYQRSVELSKTAKPGPTFQVRIRKKKEFVKMDKYVKQEPDLESVEPRQELGNEILGNEILFFSKERRDGSRKNGSSNNRRKKDELLALLPSVVPQGSLGIDELAKLLS